MPAAKHPPRRLKLIIAALLVVAAATAAGIYWTQSGPQVVEIKNALGEIERCASCHPAGARKPDGPAHPEVSGHTPLASIGCTPCHGGQPLALAPEEAHSPDVGGAPDPFLPLELVQLTCARCHVPGKLKDAELLAAGQRNYLAASCVGCHQPGGHPNRIGLDLRIFPQRTLNYLQAHLTEPRVLNPEATMWTLRDATYRDRFADSPTGRENTSALIVYALALADRIQRERWAPAQQRKGLRIDKPCTACHHVDRAETSGKAHTCPALVDRQLLRCGRCHERDKVPVDRLDRTCPQVRAELFSCGTCHLRPDDGTSELLQSALAGPKPVARQTSGGSPSTRPTAP